MAIGSCLVDTNILLRRTRAPKYLSESGFGILHPGTVQPGCSIFRIAKGGIRGYLPRVTPLRIVVSGSQGPAKLSLGKMFSLWQNYAAESMFVGAGIFCFFRMLLVFEKAFQHLRIGDGRGDPVAFAGPFSQVDQAAALAAKREVLVAGQHQAAACGTAKRTHFLFRHTG
jgi:hypothetical protein